MTLLERARRHLLPGDVVAAVMALLLVLGGLLFYPVYYALYPIEGLRAVWRADRTLTDRLRGSGPPLWSDERGVALPAGYPQDLGGANLSQSMEWRENRLGRFYRPDDPTADRSGWVQLAPHPDERRPSLPDVPRDTWGNPWWLTVSWRERTWGVRSAGPDGVIDTGDDLQVFAWNLDGFSFTWPLRYDALLYLAAALGAWAYGLWRARGLGPLPWGWEVARAAFLVSPVFLIGWAVFSETGLPDLLGPLGALQLAPLPLAASLTISLCLAGWIVWRRVAAESDEPA